VTGCFSSEPTSSRTTSGSLEGPRGVGGVGTGSPEGREGRAGAEPEADAEATSKAESGISRGGLADTRTPYASGPIEEAAMPAVPSEDLCGEGAKAGGAAEGAGRSETGGGGGSGSTRGSVKSGKSTRGGAELHPVSSAS